MVARDGNHDVGRFTQIVYVPVADKVKTDRLELGAGGGLVGLAVAKGCDLGEGEKDGGPPPMYITDQMEMYTLMQHNIALNKLDGKVEALLLNW